MDGRTALPNAPSLAFGFSNHNVPGFAGQSFVSRLARFTGPVATLVRRVEVKRMTRKGLECLRQCARSLARMLAPKEILHCKQTLGCVPVFMDGSDIEGRRHCEQAGTSWDQSLSRARNNQYSE